MKQVICIKWGQKYGADYVNRLYGMVSRNITPPFSVHCFTDDVTGIRDEVVTHPLPKLGCEHPKNVPGKWTKTALWGAELEGIEGKALFVDLDSVIVGSLDDLFEYGDEKDVVLARNWLKPHKRLGQTTLFRFYVGAQPYMLEQFQKDPQGIADKYRFEQHYVTHNIRGGVKFWPTDWVKHYRVHCLGNYIMRYFKPAKLPAGARVIAFPGEPNPEDAMLGRWTHFEPAGPWVHVKNYFLHKDKRVRKSLRGHLCSFQLPCPWVKEHWRD